jgi:hypothetical protein
MRARFARSDQASAWLAHGRSSRLHRQSGCRVSGLSSPPSITDVVAEFIGTALRHPGQQRLHGSSVSRIGFAQLVPNLTPKGDWAGDPVADPSLSKCWETWSGRRDSNPRPQPWQGCALPLSYARTPDQGAVSRRLPYRLQGSDHTVISPRTQPLDAAPAERHGPPSPPPRLFGVAGATSMPRLTNSKAKEPWTT